MPVEVQVHAPRRRVAEGVERGAPAQHEGDAGDALQALVRARHHEVDAVRRDVERLAEQRAHRVDQDAPAGAGGDLRDLAHGVEQSRRRLVVDHDHVTQVGTRPDAASTSAGSAGVTTS